MTLRVHSGEARGRLLKTLPKDMWVRPILARIKKSLFDILRFRLPNSRWLDLYAGAGTVGIEALSNGAARVVFVEGNRRMCEIIEKNLEILGFSGKAYVQQDTVNRGLARLNNEKFDFIFMGPPYVDEDKRPLALTVPTMAKVLEVDCLAASGVLISQRFKKEPMNDLSPRWELERENRYGDTVLAFYRLRD